MVGACCSSAAQRWCPCDLVVSGVSGALWEASRLFQDLWRARNSYRNSSLRDVLLIATEAAGGRAATAAATDVHQLLAPSQIVWCSLSVCASSSRQVSSAAYLAICETLLSDYVSGNRTCGVEGICHQWRCSLGRSLACPLRWLPADVLSDEEARKLYDLYGLDGMQRYQGAGAGAGNSSRLWEEFKPFQRANKSTRARDASRCGYASLAAAPQACAAWRTFSPTPIRSTSSRMQCTGTGASVGWQGHGWIAAIQVQSRKHLAVLLRCAQRGRGWQPELT
jgi:hypothetical protein